MKTTTRNAAARIAVALSLLATPALLAPVAATAAESATAAPTTQAFVDTAAPANKFEIVSSQIALQKTTNPEIVAFAKKMIHDHTQIGTAFVAALAKSKTGLKPPAGLGPDIDATIARLKSETGVTFEKDYIAAQTAGHKAAVGLFKGYAEGGENPELKAFAAKTLPTIEMHYHMCMELEKLKL